jgi:hypothetical protein
MAHDPVFPEEVRIDAFMRKLIHWTDPVNVDIDTGPFTSGDIVATGTPGSARSIATAVDGDRCYVEFVAGAPAASTGREMGLTDDFDGLYTSIDFGIHIAPTGGWNVIEDGTTMLAGPVEVVAGDVFRVEAANGVVKYYRNSVLRYTSTVAPTYPLFAAAALLGNDARFEGVIFAQWLEIPDVQLTPAISISRGNDGTSQKDRVAETGTMSFALDNSEDNSAGLLGLYSSPNNVNVLEGWEVGIDVRCIVAYAGVDEPVFYGTIEDIVPGSGKFRERKVSVSCVDWMDEAATAKVRGLQVQLNKRSDEVFTVLINSVPRQPGGGYIAQIGGDIYPYALDNAFEGEVNVMSEFQRLVQSELGRVYVRRDGVAVFESRHKRPNLFTLSLTMTDEDIDELDTGRGRSDIINHAEVQAHPRRVDAAATSVLFTLASKPRIERNTPLTLNVLFRDPDARATRVGGTNLVQPVATTDYMFNTLESGAGTDVTSQLTVVGTFSANGGEVVVTNNGPSDGYLTKLQCRGRGIYDYETILAKADSAASKEKYGERSFPLDMPYQNDLNVAKDAAEFVVQQSKALLTQVKGVSFFANREDRLLLAALQLDVSAKIHLDETVVGNEPFTPVGEDVQEVTVVEFFINSVQMEIGERGVIKCQWALEPADPFNYWILERDGFTELGQTTRLAYGSFIAGWVLNDSVLGTGTRVNQ